MKRTILLLLMLVNMSRVAYAAPAPDFSSADPARWIGSRPMSIADLRGRVVLLNFWTCHCSNCLASLPWLTDLERRFHDRGVAVIGIHTPELASERDPVEVAEQMKARGIRYPVMLDLDYAYWKRMGNSVWPAFYVVDKKGEIRGVFTGETHQGDTQAGAIERQLLQLLSE